MNRDLLLVEPVYKLPPVFPCTLEERKGAKDEYHSIVVKKMKFTKRDEVISMPFNIGDRIILNMRDVYERLDYYISAEGVRFFYGIEEGSTIYVFRKCLAIINGCELCSQV